MFPNKLKLFWQIGFLTKYFYVKVLPAISALSYPLGHDWRNLYLLYLMMLSNKFQLSGKLNFEKEIFKKIYVNIFLFKIFTSNCDTPPPQKKYNERSKCHKRSCDIYKLKYMECFFICAFCYINTWANF